VKKGLFLIYIYILFNKTKEINKKNLKGHHIKHKEREGGGGESGIGWERSMDLRGNYKGCH
jgi:hypothetical protein